jgi:branched-subunit amino acid ABC-type transport system permease component
MIAQLLLNALISAAIVAPPAIAFTLAFSILRFPNFAVGAFITVGSYAALAANLHLGVGIAVSAAAAIVVTAVAFRLTDAIVFRPLVGHSEVTLLVVSIALSFIVESIVRLFFGSNVRGFELELTRPVEWWGLRATPDQMLVILVSAAAMIGAHTVLRYTAIGKAMRAVADNVMLAEARGIDTARVKSITLLFCGGLVGLSGVLAGMELVIEPMLGAKLIIPVFAAAILGGIGSPYGAVAGALLVALAEEVALLFLPSPYKVGVGFVIIAVTLLVRPHGIFGRPEIKK